LGLLGQKRRAIRTGFDTQGGILELQGVCAVGQIKASTNEEFHRALDELPELLTGEGTAPDGRLPDGTVYDFDYALRATVDRRRTAGDTSSSFGQGNSCV
jgi:hypothetical protein